MRTIVIANGYSETLILASQILRFLRVYTHLHGPGQMLATVMLNFNGFYVPSVSNFPEFAPRFSSSNYRNLPDFMFCSSHNFLFEAMDFLPC
jgi:hypothetical protein